ncbi:MAG: ATPase domain-containing protein [Halofilum sp. (in: g-proteobacteria)]
MCAYTCTRWRARPERDPRRGLIAGRTYLVLGGPGVGKTTLGVQFLLDDDADPSVLITLGEGAEQLRDNAVRLGRSLDAISILDLSPADDEPPTDRTYNLLESWEAESDSIHDQIIEYVRERRPSRILIDSLSQLRYLTPNTFQFRKQVLSLARYLTAAGSTLLISAEEGTAGGSDDDLQFMSDGVIHLTRGDSGLTCAVTKMRGSSFAAGAHHYRLDGRGMTVYPRLIPGEHGQSFTHESIGSGVPKLDRLVDGGIDRGTVTLVSGPTGVGKTTLAAHFMKEAAGRGERSAIYCFDEVRSTFMHRCESVGLPVHEMVDNGSLSFIAVEALHYDADQFAFMVREEVETMGARIVMIDSLAGYRQSVRGDDLVSRVHALCRYLVNMGVTVLLINEVRVIAGDEFRVSEDRVSYLADTILILRYAEIEGELRKTIGVLKKRTGEFERSLREFSITGSGVALGRPLTEYLGLLRGVPQRRATAGGDRGDY